MATSVLRNLSKSIMKLFAKFVDNIQKEPSADVLQNQALGRQLFEKRDPGKGVFL